MDKSLPSIAIVTGASSGVGIDFARELARRDYALLLTGTNEQRLSEVQKSLRDEYQRPVETLAVDLALPDSPDKLLERAVAMGTPTILVNNAGTGSFGNFLEQGTDAFESQIQTNVVALTRLCHSFGRVMAEGSGGRILNHSSFSAIQPPSNYAVYSATKSFVLTLSQTLRQNLAQQGVFVTALCSGFFDSDFAEKSGQPPGLFLRWLTMKKQRVAKAGIQGLLRGKTVVIPGLRYKCLNLLSRFLPRSVITGIANYALNQK